MISDLWADPINSVGSLFLYWSCRASRCRHRLSLSKSGPLPPCDCLASIGGAAESCKALQQQETHVTFGGWKDLRWVEMRFSYGIGSKGHEEQALKSVPWSAGETHDPRLPGPLTPVTHITSLQNVGLKVPTRVTTPRLLFVLSPFMWCPQDTSLFAQGCQLLACFVENRCLVVLFPDISVGATSKLIVTFMPHLGGSLVSSTFVPALVLFTICPSTQ